jgi:hypothetical protein
MSLERKEIAKKSQQTENEISLGRKEIAKKLQ